MWIKAALCVAVLFLNAVSSILPDPYPIEPFLSVGSLKVDIKAGSDYEIRCLGSRDLSWKIEKNSEIAKFPDNIIITRSLDPTNQSIYRNSSEYFKKAIRHFSIFGIEISLRIINATFNNTGYYTCFGLRSQSVYIFVNDPQNLMITEFLPSHSEVLYKNSTIPCLPTISTLNVTLWKQDEYVPLHENDLSFDPTKGFLLKNPTQYFNGLFTCKAKYENYSQEVSFKMISEKVKLRRPVLNVESTFNVKAGSTLKLNCTGEFPLEWSSPNWSNAEYKEVNNVTYRHYNIAEDKYVTELTIDNIQHFQTGFYSCCYRYPYCLSEDDEVEVYVFVNDPQFPFIRRRSANQLSQSEYRCVRDVVPCLPTSSDLNVTLWKGSNYIPIDRNTSFDPTRGFILHNLEPESPSYIYTCRAGNEYKEIKVSSMHLDDDKENGLHIYVSNVDPLEEEEVKVTCEVCTYKYESLIWTFGKTRIKDENELGITIINENTISSKRQTLKFDSVKSFNSGIYECAGLAKNGTSIATKSINLRITALRAPFFTHTNMNGSKVTLLSGDRHQFHCFVAGVPLPTVSWYKDNEFIKEDPPGIVMDKHSQMLTVDPIIEEDAGVFRCKAENGKGFVFGETIFVLQTINGNYSVGPIKEKTLSGGEIFLITLFVILVILFLSSLFILLKNKHGIQMIRLTEEEQEEMCISEMGEMDSQEDDKL